MVMTAPQGTVVRIMDDTEESFTGTLSLKRCQYTWEDELIT